MVALTGLAVVAGYVSPNPGPAEFGFPGAISCSQGTVAARDLWLRDEFGAPLSEIMHGQQVTIDSRPNPHGLAYRFVSADDGRTGWVDVHWIRPHCD
ncbi:hypothetical protein AB0F81_13885 [Actinoplanes sp. NPDC024001]|uniref:hypothetical protein n=1 Tax=Actinoplanes sp. NPDC024001 TaxID=3154598 RepID=UPI00340E6B2D